MESFVRVTLFIPDAKIMETESRRLLKRICDITGLDFKLPRKTIDSSFQTFFEIREEDYTDMSALLDLLLKKINNPLFQAMLEHLRLQCQIGFAIYLTPGETTPVFHLKKRQIDICSWLGAELDVDLYVLSKSEEK